MAARARYSPKQQSFRVTELGSMVGLSRQAMRRQLELRDVAVLSSGERSAAHVSRAELERKWPGLLASLHTATDTAKPLFRFTEVAGLVGLRPRQLRALLRSGGHAVNSVVTFHEIRYWGWGSPEVPALQEITTSLSAAFLVERAGLERPRALFRVAELARLTDQTRQSMRRQLERDGVEIAGTGERSAARVTLSALRRVYGAQWAHRLLFGHYDS